MRFAPSRWPLEANLAWPERSLSPNPTSVALSDLGFWQGLSFHLQRGPGLGLSSSPSLMLTQGHHSLPCILHSKPADPMLRATPGHPFRTEYRSGVQHWITRTRSCLGHGERMHAETASCLVRSTGLGVPAYLGLRQQGRRASVLAQNPLRPQDASTCQAKPWPPVRPPVCRLPKPLISLSGCNLSGSQARPGKGGGQCPPASLQQPINPATVARHGRGRRCSHVCRYQFERAAVARQHRPCICYLPASLPVHVASHGKRMANGQEGSREGEGVGA